MGFPTGRPVRAEKVKVEYIKCFFFMMGLLLRNINFCPPNCKMPPLVGNDNMQ